MDAEKASLDKVGGFEIARMARLLGVSRSGYYDWARRQAAGPSPATRRRAELTGKIAVLHAASDAVYGSPRILADLREAGEQVSAKTVAKLMRQAGIVGISPRGFVPVTTQAGPDPHPVEDLVGRRFDRGQLERGLDLRHHLPRHRARAGSTCAPSATAARAACSAGPWRTTCAPTWSKQHYAGQ